MKFYLNKKFIGLLLSIGFFFLFFLPVPEGLSFQGFAVGIIGSVMAIFWITEPIPIPITALFPLVFFPLFNIADLGTSAKGFANPVLFLFLGGFILAIAMEKWNLHRRFAFHILSWIGSNPRQLIYGFFIAVGFLSMWVNNTSTTMMFLPIAMSVVQVIEEKKVLDQKSKQHFSINIFLSIAYASSIGGISTLIGTAPNIFMASFLRENLNIQIQFLDWFQLGFPFFIVSILVVPYFLLKTFPIQEKEEKLEKVYFLNQLKNMGAFSKQEISVTLVFLCMVFAWLTQPILVNFFPLLSDSVIGIAGGITLFLFPTNLQNLEFLLDWEDIKKLPWDAMLLFGGSLSLASQIESSKLSEWIGNSLSFLGNFPAPLLMLFVIVFIMSLTQFTSNVATTAAFLPVVASFSKIQNLNSIYLIVPATISASCAFILPVATPPNTIVYATGKVPIEAMIQIGLRLSLIYIILIFIFCIILL